MARLILLCTGHVFSLLFLSEFARRGVSKINKQFQTNWKKKHFLCFSAISAPVAVLYFWTSQQWFRVLRRQYLGENPDSFCFFLWFWVWFYFSGFFFFWIASHGTFGTKPTLLWIINKLLLGSLGVQLTFQCQHSFLCSKGAGRVACGPSEECVLLGQGFLLGKEVSLWLLQWLKSWYCDTFRCSYDWLYQIIKYSYN